MNKIVGAIVLGLLVTGSQFAARRDCFRPYHAEITNKSGGLAKVHKTHKIGGVSRQAEIENNTTIRVMIKGAGAALEISAGPEGNKTTRKVDFFCKEPNAPTAHVTLNPRGVETQGFYTENKPYDVKLINESGGLLHILETVASGTKDHAIADGKSTMLTVRPGGHIVVRSGPENRKTHYRIYFAEQTGNNPTITFGGRGFIQSGIQSKDVMVAKGRVPLFRSLRRTPNRAAAEQVVMERSRKSKRVSRRAPTNGI